MAWVRKNFKLCKFFPSYKKPVRTKWNVCQNYKPEIIFVNIVILIANKITIYVLIKQEINRIIKNNKEITMITVSYLCYTIYNAYNYQYNLYNFEILYLTTVFCFHHHFFLCAFQFPMCANFVTCARAQTHSLRRNIVSNCHFVYSTKLPAQNTSRPQCAYRVYTKEWCGFKCEYNWYRTILLCIPRI